MTEFSSNSQSTEKIKILYLTKVYPYPPAVAGDAVYSKGIIEALACYSELTVLCCDNGGDGVQAPLDSNITWKITTPHRSGQALSVLSTLPLISWRHCTSDFKKNLAELLTKQWHAIIIDNLGLLHALSPALKYRKTNPNTKIIYISHEHEYPTRSAKYGTYEMGLVRRLASRLDLIKIGSGERALLKHADIVTVINAADTNSFKKICSARKFHLLLPGYNGPVQHRRRIDTNTPRRILLLGGRRSEQKRKILLDWLAISYERLIREDIETVVAGDMDESLHRQISTMYPAVRVLGFVEDLRTLINSARIGVIADTVGGGFKLRLLSHVFERLPIIGLNDAIAGLPTCHGHGYLGSQTMPDLLDSVCSTINNTELLDALQNQAFADCESEFSWSSRGANLVGAITDQTGSSLS